MTVYCINIKSKYGMSILRVFVNISFKYKMLILCMCNFKLC